jgi:hypothetical protein
MPEIPNFTASPWQERRRETQLKASILDGKGAEMPAWRGKVSDEQVAALVAHVRAFAPATDKAGAGKRQEPTAPGSFDEEFRRLQEELAESRRQFQELSAAERERAKPSEASPRRPPSRPGPSSPRPGPSKPSILKAAVASADDEINERFHTVIDLWA